MLKSLLAASILVAVTGCATASQSSSNEQETQYQASEKAINLAHEYLLVDTHIDVPYRIRDKWDDVSVATKDGDFDYPRAVEGGLDAPFMSIYIPASYEESGGSVQLAHELIDGMEALVARAPDKFAMAYSTDDIRANKEKGLMSIALGMENGTPIEGDLDNLHMFYERGIRYITLAHSLSNHISDSSYDIRRQWDGLSPFGKKLVKEMNKVGVMVDVSHISDDAFYQAVEISEVPVIASHSSLRKYTPGFERNMSDDMLKALAENEGVIQINFGSSFLAEQANRYRDMMKKRISAVKEQYGADSEEAKRRIADIEANNPYPFATLETVLDHIDHVKALIGVEHIGVGSDYDGVGDSLPVGLKDVSDYPNLVQGLLDRGYSEKEIQMILGENLMRVWKAVEDYAEGH
ncbi:peptidase M19 [Idiomarina sp. WRN-38]|uniref:dipeptidase n=1 Tax=unclassified Idiomarina TaxID=2614829 RepID=UPI0007338C76|nr:MULTISPECIES: dipeptidase [unclassified Idiomarina]KTG30119.1 peptidase M19 [Idiomarina sp. H105]MBF39206.1 membrane dipeptidase [Idiomarinaceae bacterium]MCH2454449.1 dipeptidase [Idiomarina sp.]OAF14512.1 peptidase M19 [Idiomarina sp. WRN-38]WPZ01996.1 dipeptidase [Idiomarina sp. OXR-189]|tara:strand:- start:1054 stop:2274 length:1221 start_codon:yes stop_codon:yes gene_type:complete